jgi:3-dehydroquinate dehydratase type I
MKLLKVAIENGAAMVDIEIESDYYFTSEMVAFAKKHGTKVIISYHNFESTPSIKELNEIVKECFDKGADIAKLATLVRSPRDNGKLLGLYASDKPLVVLGMGALGKITRVAAPLMGAAFTFAAVDEASVTAPGQVSYVKLNDIINSIKK